MFSRIFIIVAIFFAGLNVTSVRAEQSAAESYRQMFRSGNFYIEFKDKWGVRILAGKDGRRMERMRYDFESGGITPEVFYKDGKFYHFVDKDTANVCDKKDLDNENLDPRQGWNTIAAKLALPDELAVFCWNDPFRSKSPAIAEPKFQKSFRKKFQGNDYDCDQYVCRIKSMSGSVAAYLVYDMIYNDGNLFRVESYIYRNKKAYLINVLELKKIQSAIPEGTFKISKNTKLYSAGMGDIDDLLERPVQVGTLEDL